MRVVRLDGRSDVGQRHAALRVLRQGLRLHAAEHRRAAAFIAVGVRQLANDVFIAPPAVRQDAAQVALRARRHEQRRLFAGDGGDAFLQRIHRWVVAKHVVAQGRGHHGDAHGGRGLGDGVAAEVDGGHGSLALLVSPNVSKRLSKNAANLAANSTTSLGSKCTGFLPPYLSSFG